MNQATSELEDSRILKIAEWVQPQIVLLDADARDRTQAFEIAAAAMGRLLACDPVPMLRALWRREQVGSTALGNGIAIPHARIHNIQQPLTVFLRLKTPLLFDAPDGKPVSELLVIMVPPDEAGRDHLLLLAVVARLFSKHRFRALLDAAQDVPAVGHAFREGIASVVSVG